MNVIVGNKLKILRRDKKMSQEEVADSLRISQSAYARMESGESRSWANHIQSICQVFDITPDELLKTDSEDINLIKTKTADQTLSVSNQVIEHYETQIKELKKIIKELKSK